jgi:hypothetical protein
VLGFVKIRGRYNSSSICEGDLYMDKTLDRFPKMVIIMPKAHVNNIEIEYDTFGESSKLK